MELLPGLRERSQARADGPLQEDAERAQKNWRSAVQHMLLDSEQIADGCMRLKETDPLPRNWRRCGLSQIKSRCVCRNSSARV